MFAKLVLTDEERAVDPQLGYPRGYAKLCRHAHIQMQGLITPFTEGPPQRFLPYPPQDEDLAKLKEFDTLFPMLDEEERDPPNARKHADFLWQQLDHIGNAGFDPAKFRVDPYGNVLYWNADPGSPLAWEVDHWFPHSRGGRTVSGNLRIVQWQVNQRKGRRLEFLIPWWDLQVGVSINQFLSVFSSKNADFRQRAFNLFFLAGENEQLDDKIVVECHSWPQHFRERKNQVGLAAAALVRLQKDMDDTLKLLNANRTTKQAYLTGNSGTPQRRRWTLEEEEALRRALQKFGPGSWKEIKEFEPLLVNRSTVQIKDKYRLMRGDWQLDKENKEESTTASAIQKELKLKLLLDEERKQKEDEIVRLEKELGQMKKQNDEERAILDELEETLAKQRKRVEKQRRWSETQSQYRLCLDKMIRDTMHQCVVYKEQARLNQAACNALLARLESQKSTCDAAEMDLLKRSKHREDLEALVRPKITKRTRNEGHTDVGSYMKLDAVARVGQRGRRGWSQKVQAMNEEEESSEQHDSGLNGNESNDPNSRISEQDSRDSNDLEKEKEIADQNDELLPPSQEHGVDGIPKHRKVASPAGSSANGVKRKALEVTSELDLDVVLLGYEYGEQDDGDEKVESVGENAALSELEYSEFPEKEIDDPPQPKHSQNDEIQLRFAKSKDEEQLDELLQQVLAMQGKVNAAMEDALEEEEDEQERIRRVGKLNLDKWLQLLLLNSGLDAISEEPERKSDEPTSKNEALVDDPNCCRQEAEFEGEAHVGDRPLAQDGGAEVLGDAEISGTKVGDGVCSENREFEEVEGEEERRKGGIIGGFLRKLSFRHAVLQEDCAAPIAADKEEITENASAVEAMAKESAVPEIKFTVEGREEGRRSGRDSSVGKKREERQASPWRRTASPSFKRGGENPRRQSPWRKKAGEEKEFQTEERRVLESFGRLHLGGGGESSKNVDEVEGEEAERRRKKEEEEEQIAYEMEFVERMRASREKERRRRRQSGGRKEPSVKEAGESVDERRRHSTPPVVGPTTETKMSDHHHVPELRVPARITPPRRDESRRLLDSNQPPPPPPQLRPIERGSSNTVLTTEDLLRQRRQQLLLEQQQQQNRQRPEEEVATSTLGGGGAARKASMLMKSASTRGGSGGREAVGSPARSGSNGGRRHGGGEEEAATEAAAAGLRRKPSFFQDWDNNEGLRASLSHVWKKAVKKFDLARSANQPPP